MSHILSAARTGIVLLAAAGAGYAHAHAVDDAAASNAVLDRIVEAYRALPGLDERLRIELALPANPMDPDGERDRDEMSYRITHGENREVRIDLVEYEVMQLDGHMLVLLSDDSKYLRTQVETNLLDIFRTTFGTDYFFPISLYARHEAPRERWLHGLSMGFLDSPVVDSMRKDAGDAGDLIELSLRAESGTARIHVDPQTHLLRRAIVSFVPEGAPPSFVVDIDVAFSNEPKESGKGLIAFEPGERKAVATLAELMEGEPPLEVGTEAPNFTLTSLDGVEVKLEDLRGQIVVLDFWATWCGPCIVGLPKLQEFATYARENNLPVKVYAINVWESEQDLDKRTEVVRTFWTERNFTMPTLIDPENKVVASYRVSGIPTMFVIDQRGKVADVHVGFDPDIAEILKKKVASLRQTEG